MSSYNQPLIDTLRKLSMEGATGTLFLTQPDNRQARIGLLRGLIMHIALFTLRGELAIRALSNRPPVSFSFHPGPVPEEQSGLPSTDIILKLLAGGDDQPRGPAEAEAPRALPDSVLQAVTQELAYFVGPMASVLVNEQRAATSVDALVAELVKDLESRDEIDAFRRRVFERLRGGG